MPAAMDDEIIREFLVESNENLSRLDQEMVEIEKHPADAGLLASIFRTIHTIKGTCGFLGFETLEHITHIAENILGQVRAAERKLTPDIVSILLETVDAVKAILGCIEVSGSEGSQKYDKLCQRLTQTCEFHPDSASTGPNLTEQSSLIQVAAVPENPKPGASASTCSQNSLRIAQAPLAHARGSEAITESREFSRAGSTAPASDQKPFDRTPVPAGSQPEPSANQINTGESAKTSVADSTIRVDVGLLDRLMNLVGELVLARNQILQFKTCQEYPVFNATCQRLNAVTTELQEGVMKMRMQPIGMVWNKLPRIVRDLAGSCGKQIVLEMEGTETELDKTLIEAIKDPLTHIVRNCCDHGIERPEARISIGKSAQGRLQLRAFHEGGHVNIEIADDGGGIDPERVKSKAVQKGLIRPEEAARLTDRDAVQLVFLPGFSTAEQITSISGRGVGMDVVKTNIEKIGGMVDLSSSKGHGTSVRIKIPLTLAIIPGLVVTSAGMTFIIPQTGLAELIRLEGEAKKQIEYIRGNAVYRRRGRLLPIAYLDRLLQFGKQPDRDILNIAVLQTENCRLGLVVDTISDTQEIVVKPLGKILKGIECFAGATIMGDGKVALILDVAGLCRRAGIADRKREPVNAEDVNSPDSLKETQSLLLLSAGIYERIAVPLSPVARLEEIPFSRVERAGGGPVVQYRGGILPLVFLGEIIGNKGPESSAEREEILQIVVFRDGVRQLGLVVDRIIDIVESHATHHNRSTVAGLLGSAVVNGKITDFLDLKRVLQSSAHWNMTNAIPSGITILVADASSFTRSVVRSHLEMGGHRVLEAGSVPEAIERVIQSRAEIILANPRLPGGGGEELRKRLVAHPDSRRIPIVAIGTSTDQIEQLRNEGTPCDAFCLDSEPDSILESIQSLASVVGHTTVDFALN